MRRWPGPRWCVDTSSARFSLPRRVDETPERVARGGLAIRPGRLAGWAAHVRVGHHGRDGEEAASEVSRSRRPSWCSRRCAGRRRRRPPRGQRRPLDATDRRVLTVATITRPGEARNTIAFAISSGVAARPRWADPAICSAASWPTLSNTVSLSVGPGATALTRTVGPNSAAQVRVSDASAAFDAA